MNEDSEELFPLSDFRPSESVLGVLIGLKSEFSAKIQCMFKAADDLRSMHHTVIGEMIRKTGNRDQFPYFVHHLLFVSVNVLI